MPHIHPSVAGSSVTGLTRLYQGKVRDTYELPGHPKLMLVVASDRISIFDFVLKALIPQKGAILTAMNVFWRQFFQSAFPSRIPHDLIAYGRAIDEYLPSELRGDVDLQLRAVVVKRLSMQPYEAIVRGYLTGSGLKDYQRTGIVGGHQLPEGLHDGSKLPEPIFAPSTKAAEGHDENITAAEVQERFGYGPESMSLMLYDAAARYAIRNGIIFADTKFEFGKEGGDSLILGDEVITPDSSRFWKFRAWQEAQKEGKLPGSLDKQIVRNWGKTVGLDDKKRKPQSLEDAAWAHHFDVPHHVSNMTTAAYRFIFWKLTGEKLEQFQKSVMGVNVQPRPLAIEVLIGSESDRKYLEKGLDFLKGLTNVATRLHFCSCHRNPNELRAYAMSDIPVGADIRVIAGAGMSAQLPGVLKGWLDYFGNGHIPVLGVGFPGKTEDATEAARLSIEQLPGRPVQLDSEDHAYMGADGFLEACNAAVREEFEPLSYSKKVAQFNVPF